MSANEPDFTQLAELDRLVHEPSRLAILATLAGCESADFQFLLNTTGLNKGNLSAHAIKLEQVGYVEVEKGFSGKSPYTLYRLTPAGRNALKAYQAQLQQMLVKLDESGPALNAELGVE
ncbi:MAG: transcriptional regulator [Anaerolineaceae bacterium]|nr:transcriptional regulator [Anaerolineaceae bacterium]